MLDLVLGPSRGPLRILCLGAHCDDIEIGCGGTLLKLLAGARECRVRWVVMSSHGERAQEGKSSASRFLRGASESEVLINDFRDGYFPYIGAEIKDYFEQEVRTFSPDVIFTHHHQDLHQDHRLVSELTWNTFRGHLILEYEIPKYDGDLGRPNLYSPLDAQIVEEKVQTLVECYPSQHGRHWFEPETFLALMRLRGIEAGPGNRYAEAFFIRKGVLGVGG